MSDTPHIPAPTGPAPSSPEDWTRPFEMRQLQMLGDLAEVGLEVARAVERRTREAEPEEDLTRLALAYSRAARAVRLSAMLQSRLIKDIKADAQAASKGPAEAAKAEAERVAERKAEVCRDLGLEPDWGELAQEWWAVTEIESGDVGWPLASKPTRPLPLAGEGDREAVERAFSFDTA